jgi:hypothetical protein
MSIHRCAAGVAFSVALALGCVATLAARPLDGPLDDAKRRQEVAVQKAERDLLDARDEIFRTGLSDPDKAINELKALADKLDEDTVLPREKRDALKARLNKSIAYFQRLKADRKLSSPAEEAKRIEATKDRRATDERRADDQKKVTGVAGDLINKRKEAATESRRINEEKGEKSVAVMRNVDKSAIPEASDYNLPRDWVEKSMRRAKNFKLSPTEEAILKALNEPRSADFKGMPFSEAVNYIQKLLGVPVIADPQALAEVGVNNETPVPALTTNKIATRTMLKKLLAELNLTYVVKDETIYITSAARAKEMMTVRTYYVGDLANAVDMRFGPFLSRLQAQQNLAQLVTLITQSIDPSSWEVNGGNGTITFEPITMSLVIKQSAEVHYQVRGGLR